MLSLFLRDSQVSENSVIGRIARDTLLQFNSFIQIIYLQEDRSGRTATVLCRDEIPKLSFHPGGKSTSFTSGCFIPIGTVAILNSFAKGGGILVINLSEVFYTQAK